MPGVPDEPLTPEDFLNRPAWHAWAACRDMETDLFFSARGQSVGAAKAVCESCGVRQECLASAQANPEIQGIWGGLSERERKLLRRGAA